MLRLGAQEATLIHWLYGSVQCHKRKQSKINKSQNEKSHTSIVSIIHITYTPFIAHFLYEFFQTLECCDFASFPIGIIEIWIHLQLIL